MGEREQGGRKDRNRNKKGGREGGREREVGRKGRWGGREKEGGVGRKKKGEV